MEDVVQEEETLLFPQEHSSGEGLWCEGSQGKRLGCEASTDKHSGDEGSRGEHLEA